ncbi:MAG: surface antigen [Caulobacteraceae bacterium]|nr:surface antigen [Caulobacteraceae bacterium]
MVLAAPMAVHAAEPLAKIEGDLPPEVMTVVSRAVGDELSSPDTRFEARRRAREAATNAIAALRSEGYYAYEVEPDVADSETPQAILRIKAGPRFLIARPQIDWTQAPPETEAQDKATAAMGLTIGAPGRAADILAAEGRIVASARDDGYPDAATGERQVVVDHADDSVQPTFRIVAGDKVYLDGLDITGAERTDQAWLRALTPWIGGDAYTPAQVGELERRLRDTGVYDSVTVALASKDKLTKDGWRPVAVTLVERKPRQLEADAGYSTAEGFGLDLRQIRYNQFHRGDTTTLSGRLAQLEQRIGADISQPGWRLADQTLHLTSSIFNLSTDAYDSAGIDVGADFTRRQGRSTTSYRTFGADVDAVQTREKTKVNSVVVVGDKRRFIRLTGLASFAIDRSDDPLDPRRGWRVTAKANPTLTIGKGSVPLYLKIETQGTLYYPFDAQGRSSLAARLKVGSILGGLIPEVAADRRFYSGGGGSVRGYAYQAVGPRLPDDTPQGGLSLIESSLEFRQKIGQRWGGVAFVDTGSVASDQALGQADFRAGLGVGVRYDLGFGPIRADIAIPLNKRPSDAPFQVYLSIGQSF